MKKLFIITILAVMVLGTCKGLEAIKHYNHMNELQRINIEMVEQCTHDMLNNPSLICD